MSEKLDPEEVHQIMDGFFKILMDEIHRFEGTINQFTGDGIMAFFGAPVAHEDHAQRACYAALSIQKAIQEYGDKVEKETRVPFKMRIGLNSGQVIVGAIGDDLRMDYSALGDTTNLAARIEQAAKPGTILISEQVHRIVESYFVSNHLSKLDVKGKDEPQKAYELVQASEVTTRLEASAARGLTSFVGRKKSMAALMEIWEKVESRSGQVVGIVGEAGVGKSRLLLEFRNRLSQGESVFLQGQCLHYGANMPYLPIMDIVKTHFGITEDDREYIVRKKIREGLGANLADAILPLQELLSLKADDESFGQLEAKEKKERTFEALRDLLLKMSEQQPLILAIEDLHWIDNTSQEFLDYLIGWIATKPVMLLLLYRPEYAHQWGSRSFYNRIGIDHLGPESSMDLVRAMLAEGEVAPELRDLILERASGNPLFMEEFTHNLQEEGTIRKEDDRYVLKGSISEIDVPETVQGIIAARMDRLEDNLKRTMQVASVIGRDFAYRILQRISGMKEELKSYLLNLQGLEFIFEKSLFPELEYIFKHALTRDVAYNSLLQKRRKEIHEQIGLAIEELYADRLEELYEVLSHHFCMSDNHTKTMKYLKLCIWKAANNYANWEAFRYGQEAISLLHRLPVSKQDVREHIEVRLLIINVVNALAFPENSLDILHEGEQLSRDSGDPALLRFLSRLSYCYGYKGEHDKSLEYAERACAEANKSGDTEEIASTSAALCNSIVRTFEMKRVTEIAPRAISSVEDALTMDHSNPLLIPSYTTLCNTYGLALLYLGNLEESRSFFRKAFRAAEETRFLVGMGVSKQLHGGYLYYVGDIESAISHAREAIEWYTQANAPSVMLGSEWYDLCMYYTELGEYLTAKECGEKGLSIHDEASMTGHHQLHLRALHFRALAAAVFELGDHQKGVELIGEAIETASQCGEIGPEGIAMVYWGHYSGRANPSEWERAEEAIRKGLEILDGLELKLWIAEAYLRAGEMHSEAGQRRRAREYFALAESSFREMTCDYWADKAKQAFGQLGR